MVDVKVFLIAAQLRPVTRCYIGIEPQRIEKAIVGHVKQIEGK